MIRGPTNREAAGLVAGFALWSLAFVLLYGGHGLICSAALPIGESSARALLLSAWALMIAGHVALIVWFVRRLRAAETSVRFVRMASLVLAIAALGATVWTGIPLIGLTIC
jgi:hypothetical protein